MKSDLDVSSVRHLVVSAGCHEGQTESELTTLNTDLLIDSRCLTENTNPNTRKYLYMWQSAYNAVVSKIKRDKFIRSEWGRILGLHKEQAAREAFLLEHSQKNGKFRALARQASGKGEGIEEEGFSLEDMINYRNSLSVKKRKMSGIRRSSTPNFQGRGKALIK
mmetsp:Transcript_16850/g.31634  ORF Transcript_16850/g.31634 Transcript_16850/m.31634 type:complete len:164 (+) Transcript_16850:260-751(+)